MILSSISVKIGTNRAEKAGIFRHKKEPLNLRLISVMGLKDADFRILVYRGFHAKLVYK